MIAAVLRLLKISVTLYILYLLWFTYSIYNYKLYKPLSEKVQTIRDSNITYFGSCGWIAYLTSEYLDKNHEKYEIYRAYNSNQPNIHIFISTDNYIFDYNGFHPRYLNVYSFFRNVKITKEELYKMIHQDIWNEKFNLKDSTVLKSIYDKD